MQIFFITNIILWPKIISEVVLPSKCFYFSFTLFTLSIVGLVLNKKSVINLLVCLEIIFLSVCLNFIFFSIFFYDLKGQIYALFIIIIAASESVVGLGLLILIFRKLKSINFKFFSKIRH